MENTHESCVHGRLTSISDPYSYRGNTGGRLQNFICSCGKRITRKIRHVHSGRIRSCGCLAKDATIQRNKKLAKHGQRNTPTYRSWVALRCRCRNPKHHAYHNYGGRGIKVHPDFETFQGFLAHVGERPGLAYSIDRIDVNGDYAPGNVRWATAKEQIGNTRVNRLLEYQGEVRTVAEWSRMAVVSPAAFLNRIHLGWPIAEAISRPKGYIHNRALLKRTTEEAVLAAIATCSRASEFRHRYAGMYSTLKKHKEWATALAAYRNILEQ